LGLAENLWSTIKIELLYWSGTTFAARAEAEAAILRYIDGWYNPRRIQHGLDGMSPDEYEEAHYTQQNRLFAFERGGLVHAAAGRGRVIAMWARIRRW
jgi:hypothetical protein